MTDTKYRFYFPLQVSFADTDLQGHVFFGTYFTFFDEGMSAYLREIGFPWPTFQEMDLDFYYVDAQCHFKGPAYFEDLLHVHTRINRIGNTSFTLEFAIYKKESDQLIATGHITGVTVDAKTSQPVRVPDRIRQAVANYEGKL